MEGTTYSSRLLEQGDKIIQQSADTPGVGGVLWRELTGAVDDYRLRDPYEQAVYPVVVPFLAPSVYLFLTVCLILGNAHRDLVRSSVAVACSIIIEQLGILDRE